MESSNFGSNFVCILLASNISFDLKGLGDFCLGIASELSGEARDIGDPGDVTTTHGLPDSSVLESIF